MIKAEILDEIGVIQQELNKRRVPYQMNWSDYKGRSKIMILGSIYDKELLINLINYKFYFDEGVLIYDIIED